MENVDAQMRSELSTLRDSVHTEGTNTRVAVAELAGKVDTIQASLTGQISVAGSERTAMTAELSRMAERLNIADTVVGGRFAKVERDVADLQRSWAFSKGRMAGAIAAISTVSTVLVFALERFVG